jgi:sugar/nucleoside kinase (ribokinase family)
MIAAHATTDEHMFDLITFGDPCIDYVYSLGDPWREGGKMLGRYLGPFAGGTCANVACAASAFGLSTAIVGRCASGAEGALQRASLTSFGVAQDLLISVDVERGSHAIIAIGPDGEKSLIYSPLDGPIASQTEIWAALTQTRLAYCMAADFGVLAEAAKGAPARIAADFDAAAGLRPEGFAAIRDALDLIFINEIGFAALLGAEPDGATMPALLGPRATIACCTGGGGTTWMAVREAGAVSVTAVQARPATVVDTTGAGDCFNAAFLAAHLLGATPKAALDRAMTAGALAVTRMGARAGFPTRAELDKA